MSNNRMHPPKVLVGEHTIVSAGVDWMTCTAPRHDNDRPLYELALSLIEAEKAAGNELHKFSLAGFKGYGAGGARYGVKDDAVLLQMSSEVARLHWREAFKMARNVSRLDVQATVHFDEAQPQIVKVLHRDAIESKSSGGRPSNRTLITSTHTGDTLLIGQRASDVYMRAYDKGIESKVCEAGRLLRYEVEFKKERARLCASRIYDSDRDDPSCIGVVTTAFGRQGVRVPATIEQGQWDSLSLARTSTERKILWLQAGVAPTIQFLLKHVGRDVILSSLGLSPDESTSMERKGE